MSAGQLQLHGNHDEDPSIQSAIEVAMKKQNNLLRQMVEEMKDEITELKFQIAQMDSRETGIYFSKQYLTFN